MIKKLTLRNWRNYEDVTFRFGPGTTFVVASNGVGKTSLVEAARWAIFGTKASDGNDAIRVGETSAVAIVDLELPNMQVITVERALTSNRRSTSPPAIRLDGAPVSPEEFHRLLRGAYGADPGFLASLTMPAVRRDDDKPSALGLEEHLGRYYGADGLRRAVGQLNALQKANRKRISQTKASNSTSAQRLAQLRRDVEDTARRVEEAAEAQEAVADRLEKVRQRELLKANLSQWERDYAAWSGAVESLAARVSEDLGRTVAVTEFEEELEQRLADLDRQIEAVRVDIGVNDAKGTTLAASEERLDSAHDDCPVCRRPLDELTVASAHEANMRDLTAVRRRIRELKTIEGSLATERSGVAAALGEWRRVPRLGERPQIALADEEQATVEELKAVSEDTLSALVEARASHLQATRERDEALAANDAMRELTALFRREASLKVAMEATDSTLRELLDDTIRPLAAEVNQRWKSLFAGRGELATASSGNITRTVNGHPLPYDSFSTGEGMSLTILLRLLVAQMATSASFCWFDEPLEHLDPEVRREVASLLAQVTSDNGPFRQVVVTTYEEPLARLLHARDERQVNLIDVRQAR